MRRRRAFLRASLVLIAIGAAGCGDDENTVKPPPKVEAIADLRADVNRNGTIDLDDPTEDQAEDTWGPDHGAILLANIDDDSLRCPKSGTNDSLAACNDAADEIVNGPDDLLDLARLKTASWLGAPKDASAKVNVGSPGLKHVRLFKGNGAEFQLFDPATGQMGQDELIAGVEFAIEAKDIVRDSTWDGTVDITLQVHGGTGPDGKPIADVEDSVRLRVAPIIFRHHLDPAHKVYATNFYDDPDSAVFRDDLATAAQASGITEPLVTFKFADQWTQDFFETTYMSMPGEGGAQQVMHVNFRSANFDDLGLRAAGKFVFSSLRGKDVAGAVQYDPSHPDEMDSLNSFGNTETVPPYSHNGVDYPLGRVLRGSNPQFYPDPSFDALIEAQGIQPILAIDTEWLFVGHVDETVSFIKADSPRGWALLANDAPMAKKMLQDAMDAGHGDVPMFVDQMWWDGAPAQKTISEVLNDTDVMNASAWAAVEVDAQVAILQKETGLTAEEIVPVPFLHQEVMGYSIAYNPATVNGIYLSDKNFGAAEPHGPVIDGQDIFKKQLEQVLAPRGITVRWIEDWNLYHALDGDVHCGSNVTRAIPAKAWWETGT